MACHLQRVCVMLERGTPLTTCDQLRTYQRPKLDVESSLVRMGFKIATAIHFSELARMMRRNSESHLCHTELGTVAAMHAGHP